MSSTNPTADKAPFVLEIQRTFNAPKQLVFEAWSDPKHLTKWYGPRGFTITNCEVDLSVKGKWHFSMEGPNNFKMWQLCIYQEISPYDLLSFVNCFSNEAGEIIAHPMRPEWPKETLVQLFFTEDNGKTHLRLRANAINTTDEGYKIFEENSQGVNAGWSGAFDQLDEYLASMV